MFCQRYWAPRYWANRYWAPVGLDAPPGHYWNRDYWAGRYWPYRYWDKQSDTNPFVSNVTTGLSVATGMTLGSMSVDMTNAITATVTSGLTIGATVGLNATPTMNFGNEFIAAAPLEIAMATSIAISATVQLGFDASANVGYYWGGRYWAARYWAPRYWETQVQFEATVTSGLAIAAGMNVGAVPAQSLTAGILSTITMNVGISITGDTAFPIVRHTAPGGLKPTKSRRNYTYKGKTYYQITNDELARLIAADMLNLSREDIQVAIKGKKPHKISKDVFENVLDTASKMPKAESTDEQDIEDIIALL